MRRRVYSGSRWDGERPFRSSAARNGKGLTITGAVGRNHRAWIRSQFPVVFKYPALLALVAVAVWLPASTLARAEGNEAAPPYGLPAGIVPTASLRMPPLASGKVPPLLSQTGAFSDTRNLVPSPGLIPYDIVVPFWSDGAPKARWGAAPTPKIKY